MADSTIKNLTAATTLTAADYFVIDSTASGTRAITYENVLSEIEGDLSLTDPTNVDSSFTDGTNLQADIRAIVGEATEASIVYNLQDLTAHISATGNKHDASEVTYTPTSPVGSSETNVAAELDSLRSLLTDNYSQQMVLINYNIDSYSTSGDYYNSSDGVVELTEEMLLEEINRQNTGSTYEFDWALDHKLMVDIYQMTKADSKMSNVAQAVGVTEIFWQSDNNRIHLDKIQIDDGLFSSSVAYKIMVYTRLFKNYPLSIS